MIIDEDSDGGEGFVGVAGNSSGRKWGPGRGGPAGDGGPLTTAAVVALALYGFDEAILLDSPREIFVERSVQEAVSL